MFLPIIAIMPGPGGAASGAPAKISLTSSTFAHKGAIPALHTCQGKDVSPPLQWSGVPVQAKSLVLIMDDPDAPDPAHPKMTWVHWVVYDIPPQVNQIEAGVKAVANLTHGGTHGITDFKRMGYGGPCPPIGEHRYFFKLYALDTMLNLPPGKTKIEVEKAMAGHAIAHTELIGTYKKS